MASINPQEISGKWLKGYALDVHTTSSTYIGVDEYGRDRFDTTRSELGELLVRLKYRSDQGAAEEIIAAAADFLRPRIQVFDRIVPVPPSATRAVQPVLLLANGIGQALGVPVVDCITTTRPGTQLKDVSDPGRREELLQGLYDVDASRCEGGHILLFDDLFRSGATMNAVTEILMGEGRAASVRALTVTRTRSNQ